MAAEITGWPGGSPPPAPDDARDGSGWLLRVLKAGEQVEITAAHVGAVLLELRTDARGRPRIAIRAPREVNIAFIKLGARPPA